MTDDDQASRSRDLAELKARANALINERLHQRTLELLDRLDAPPPSPLRRFIHFTIPIAVMTLFMLAVAGLFLLVARSLDWLGVSPWVGGPIMLVLVILFSSGFLFTLDQSARGRRLVEWWAAKMR